MSEPSFPDADEIAAKERRYNASIAGGYIPSQAEQDAIAASQIPGVDTWESAGADWADTMLKVLPAPVEIVQGLVCEQSKLLIGGASKTYKTWFLMGMGMAIAVGGEFLGRACLKKRVLYINLELRQVTYERRLQDIASNRGFHADYGLLRHYSLRGLLCKLSTSKIVDKIIEKIKDFKAEVVCLDPLYKVNTQASDENSAGEQTSFLNELDRITTDGACTLLMNDHFGKGNQAEKDPLDAFRGSSVKGGDVDAALTLRRHKEDGSFSVDVVHRELPPVDPFVITWQYPLFHLEPELDASDMKQPKRGRPKLVDSVVILEAFQDTSPLSGFSISSLSKKIGMARQTLQGHMTTLRAKGWIATSGDGTNAFQFITKKGTEKLAQNNAISNEQ